MPTPDKSRRSVYEIVRLPEAFGVVLLTVALILFLSPYLSGADFGIFKIPGFPDGTARALRILGPAVFLLSLFLFLPVWRASNAAVEPQALRAVPGGTRLKLTTPESVPDLVGRAMSRYGGRRWAGKPRLADLATVLAELALNAFEHGGASYVDIGFYKYSVVLQDDGGNSTHLSSNPRELERRHSERIVVD